MKAFLSRSKRKLTPDTAPHNPDPEEPTELKLALLASLHPALDQETLLDILLAHDGSVSEASASLKSPPSAKKPNSGGIGYQQSLRQYTLPASNETPSPAKKLKSKKGSTLRLYDPDDVAEHTPCTIIHNFLPPEVANDLLKELLDEAKTFEKITFKLFDNVVASPHTSSFYVESYDDIQKQKTDYHYNGARLTVSPAHRTPELSNLPCVGCSQDHAATRQSQAYSPRSRQPRNPEPHPDSLPWWEEAQIPVAEPLGSELGLRQLLQGRTGECGLA